MQIIYTQCGFNSHIKINSKSGGFNINHYQTRFRRHAVTTSCPMKRERKKDLVKFSLTCSLCEGCVFKS
jgi:hypothetical protein